MRGAAGGGAGDGFGVLAGGPACGGRLALHLGRRLLAPVARRRRRALRHPPRCPAAAPPPSAAPAPLTAFPKPGGSRLIVNTVESPEAGPMLPPGEGRGAPLARGWASELQRLVPCDRPFLPSAPSGRACARGRWRLY